MDEITYMQSKVYQQIFPKNYFSQHQNLFKKITCSLMQNFWELETIV
jgi:hypothetical protein